MFYCLKKTKNNNKYAITIKRIRQSKNKTPSQTNRGYFFKRQTFCIQKIRWRTKTDKYQACVQVSKCPCVHVSTPFVLLLVHLITFHSALTNVIKAREIQLVSYLDSLSPNMSPIYISNICHQIRLHKSNRNRDKFPFIF